MEKFLDLDEKDAAEIVSGLTAKWDYEAVKVVVERLKRLR